MEVNKDRFPLLRKILKAIGLPAEAVDDIVERILDWLSTKDAPATGFSAQAFKLRDDFLSPAETSFFQVLRTAVGDQAIVFTKINLADLFFVATGDHRQNRALANRIDRKHVDFLVCDLRSVRPLVALELDDQSHNRADRQTRDALVEDVFAAAGLPLLRVPVKTGYTLPEIQTLLKPYLQPVETIPQAPLVTPEQPATSSDSKEPLAPACPKCGATMLQRIARSGANTGGKFWGCPNYPRCRATLPLVG